jgi:hypothetical protein
MTVNSDAQDRLAALDRFAARAVRLTPAERSALARVHRQPPDSYSYSRWWGRQRDTLEFGLDGLDRIDAAYAVAAPFSETPVEIAILNISLVIVDPPADTSIAEVLLSGWGEVIGDLP